MNEYLIKISTNVPLSDWEQAELEQVVVDHLSPGDGESVTIEEVY